MVSTDVPSLQIIASLLAIHVRLFFRLYLSAQVTYICRCNGVKSISAHLASAIPQKNCQSGKKGSGRAAIKNLPCLSRRNYDRHGVTVIFKKNNCCYDDDDIPFMPWEKKGFSSELIIEQEMFFKRLS